MTHSGSTAKTRIRFIDTARGIAIICIILGHLGSASINRVVYTFHIPLFFLITGYFKYLDGQFCSIDAPAFARMEK